MGAAARRRMAEIRAAARRQARMYHVKPTPDGPRCIISCIILHHRLAAPMALGGATPHHRAPSPPAAERHEKPPPLAR
jgi:hypothetical protein